MNICHAKIGFILTTNCGSTAGKVRFFRACACGRPLTIPDDYEKRRAKLIDWFRLDSYTKVSILWS